MDNGSYLSVVLAGKAREQIWHWNTWQKVEPSITRVLSLGNGKIGVESGQIIFNQKKKYVLGN